MADKSRPHPLITWILTGAVVLSPFGVSLATAFPFIGAVNPEYVAPMSMVLDALLSSAPLPSAVLFVIGVSLNLLPVLRQLTRLPLLACRVPAILLSLLLLLPAGLAAPYAYIQAASTCYAHMAMEVFLAPASWVYFVSAVSISLAVLIGFRVDKELRAA
jgi:hypothetical protein